MREFRIKVNNEKTYVVKAKDYNQAVKTLHSKLRDFDDTKKNINVVREFITNNGGKFSKSKDADAILDFIYEKTGVKNADYGDVLYIVKNYTNVKVEDSAVNDSISKYNGEDAIKTNGFVKIKEDGDWTSYKYNGSDFDDAVFKIHQYNPSLIAFISNGNRTITVRNKYLNDADDTAQGEIEVLKSFGFDYKDGRWVKESNNNDIIVQPDYHYVSVIGPGDTEKHCKKYQYQSAGMLKKIISSNIKDSSIKDDLTMVEKYKGRQIYKDDNGYYYFTPAGGRGAKVMRANTSDLNKVKKLIDKDEAFFTDNDIKDADPVKVEKIIRKEKSALGITYYLFQTKSNSGATIYYEVTDKSYHGEPTYSGGGVISFSLQSANDSLDSHLLSDKLIAKYGEAEGRKRFLHGENDSAIKDSSIKDAGEEIRYLEGMKFNGVPYTGWAVQHWTDGYYTFDGKKPYIPSGGRDALLSIFKQGGFIGQWKGIQPDKGFESYFRHSTAVPAIKDSNNIKNRKSYTIKIGDKQYKVFAESESEAIDKYIKSKKQ